MSTGRQTGAIAAGPLVQLPDPRVGEIDRALRAVESVWRPGLAPVKDMQCLIGNSPQSLGVPGQLMLGLVVHSIARVGWYKVQLGSPESVIAACGLSPGGLTPLGPRDVGAYPPNSLVLVHKPPGLNYGIIVGAVPPQLRDGRLANPDWIMQGGQSGCSREEIHKYPFKNLYKGGSIIDFSAHRPFDGTALERGWISSTGIAVTVDDYLAQIRVNEMCGAWFNYFDSHARIAGIQFDLQTAVHELQVRDDEGEARHFTGVATYPWEALGLYRPQTNVTKNYTDMEVQYTKAFAKLDVPDDAADVQPIYRYQEYGGYLGQGHYRSVSRPAKDEGIRHRSDTEPDEGLFAETIGLDGSYALRSAKEIYIGRRVKIVIPREIRLPEDGLGDDAAAENYKASSEFGEGTDHKIGDTRIEGDHKSLRRVAGVMDCVAKLVNWTALHPFHYHAKDYATPQERAQNKNFSTTQEKLDFSTLESSWVMTEPEPVKLKIDHRYNEVSYFERESFLYFLEHGGVMLADGFGSSLTMNDGNMRLAPPGNLELCPGRDLIVMGGQVIIRAQQSVDISASDHDVRIKAEKNLQMLAGNGGSGGLLLESKGAGRTQQYDQIGEDVESSGIVLRAKDGIVGTYGKEIYLRTGGPNGNGNIVIDAAQGESSVLVTAKKFDLYSTQSVSFYFGPEGENSTVNQAYQFSKNRCIVDATMAIGGRTTIYRGSGNSSGLVVDGSVLASDNVISAGSIADQKGGFIPD